ncbi:helix-turn-helix domain-containing protein [Actinomadura nitritigenes]|uniref:helix-turn-helix domain-containing protein n=1 Tax=Actinomadura nitritigenes TaxID=134602 RepID=UPI003D92AEC7
MTPTTTALSDVRPVGEQLRAWRLLRKLSQLELACEVDMSTRHLSYVETGRSVPSRAMVLRLAEYLDVPLRDRNLMLLAAGYAPVFSMPLRDPNLVLLAAGYAEVFDETPSLPIQLGRDGR